MSDFFNNARIYLTSGRISKTHFRILLGLTLIMVVIASMPVIPGVIDHPQFTTNLGNWAKDLLKGNFWYKGFFIVDFFWSFLLLWIAWKLVKKYFKVAKFTRFGELCFQIFTVIVILAWVFDCIENYYYFVDYEYSLWIAKLKMIFYGLTFLTVLIVIAYQYFLGFLPTFIGFLKSSFYSLIILAVIGVFLPKAPQVNSIIVNLYEFPLNFLIILFIAPTYAVVLAHYPSYFNINGKLRDWYSANIKLGLFGTIFYKAKKVDDSEKKDKPVTGYLNFLFRTLGILFYVALFYVVGYTSEINFGWNVSISTVCIALFGIGTFLLYYLRKEKNKWLDVNFKYLDESLPDFYDGDYTPKQDEITAVDEEKTQTKAEEQEEDLTDDEREDALMKIKNWIIQYLIVFIITILAHIAFFVFIKVISEEAYTYTTAIFSLSCIGLQMITYIYYRTFRSVFRFTFFDEKNVAVLNAFYILRVIEVEPEEKTVTDGQTEVELISDQVTEEQIHDNRTRIIDFFKKHKFVKDRSIYSFFRAISFGALSNNISYLQVTIFIGIINALFILIINFYDSAALYFNPILIILSYLFLFYGIIVVITKNIIYYRFSREKFARNNRLRFNFLLVLSALVLFGANRLGRAYSNNLFTLKLIESPANNDVSLRQYVDSLPQESTKRYYIGAYGGGMKANAWTLTVLNKLDVEDSATFFDKTIGISGASGGTMGLINMAAIINGAKHDSLWSHHIRRISTSNILAVDLTHILGRDTFNHMLVPAADLRGYDRSSKAMNIYAKFSGNGGEVCKPSSYRDFWKTIYSNRSKRFPVLIANSTNVLGNQGMAVSVKVEDSILRKLLYQGATNILDISKNIYDKNKEVKTPVKKEFTLSYYDAASTSNRFPVISPAAEVETIGHFNDGGIYDNSGLLSAFKLFKAINYQEGINDLDSLEQTNVFVNIVNDKNLYIRHTVEEFLKKLPKFKRVSINKINKSTEINAILGSIASTEMMPIYIKTELQRLAEKHPCIFFETVYLPHRFTVADIKSIYGKSFDFGDGIGATYKSMYNCVIENDSIIRSKIKSNRPIIEPPMSRMITGEAHEFMEQMLIHPTTEDAINNILKY